MLVGGDGAVLKGGGGFVWMRLAEAVGRGGEC